MSKEITVQQGLREVKLLEKRISDTVYSSRFTQTIAANQSTVNGKTVSEFETDANAAYQSITALRNQLVELKAKIALSNAVTTVEIGGKTMSVATALANKDMLAQDKSILAALTSQLGAATTVAKAQEEQLNASAIKAATALYGTSTTSNPSTIEYNKFVTEYIEKNKPKLVGLKDIEDKRDALKLAIDTFEAEVDWKLTEVNVRTMITLDSV